MEIVLKYGGFVHFLSVISFFLLLFGATQFRHSNPLVHVMLCVSGISIFYSAYHLFTLKEDDPQAVELDVFKKVLVFFSVSFTLSMLLVYLDKTVS